MSKQAPQPAREPLRYFTAVNGRLVSCSEDKGDGGDAVASDESKKGKQE